MVEAQERKRKDEMTRRNNVIKQRMEKMSDEVIKDRGIKEKEHEMILLNRIKEKEAKEVLKENSIFVLSFV